jgi:hypothetical protein
MKLNDDTLLTAYLDGELSRDDRHAVEAALKSNPRLVAQLRELAAVRGLVAGLFRPGTPYDMVGPVMARLSRRPWDRLWARRSELAMGSGLAAAAVLLIGLTIWRYEHSVGPLDQHAPQIASSSNSVHPAPVVSSAAPALPKTTVAPPTTAPSVKPDPAALILAGPDRNEVDRDRERQRILNYLDGAQPDSPSVRRIILTADQLETAASEVQQLLINTPRTRPHFGRMALTKGFEVDPKEPGEAVVFVLVMDETELRYVRKEIEGNLHFSMRDAGVLAPAVVTMLADIGQVGALNGQRADRLLPPPAELGGNHSALKEPTGKKDTLFIPGDLPPGADAGFRLSPDSPPTPTNSAEQTGAAGNARKAESAKTSPSPPDRPMTVLIWVKAKDGQGR